MRFATSGVIETFGGGSMSVWRGWQLNGKVGNGFEGSIKLNHF
jgi:hypothetical protein